VLIPVYSNGNPKLKNIFEYFLKEQEKDCQGLPF
jgi:hypothetical protein